ncbi:MAG: hypothetical protein ABSC05_23625 [Candidatus Solibacter sp.]
MNAARCFPNYFRDIREAQTHELYVDAVSAFSRSEFETAESLFERWLTIHSDRAHSHDLRFDNIRIFEAASRILARIKQHFSISKEDWRQLNELFEDAYAAPSTWAFVEALSLVRALSLKTDIDKSGFREVLDGQIVGVAKAHWRLLLFDNGLLGSDKTVDIESQLGVPCFFYIFDNMSADIPHWQELLWQNIKNMLILMADYEYYRYRHRTEGRPSGSSLKTLPAPSEGMSLEELKQVILTHLGSRSPQYERQFRTALSHIDESAVAIDCGRVNPAVVAQEVFLGEVRIWPHVVRVESQERKSVRFFADEEPDFLANRTTASRLWNRKEKTIVFEGPQEVQEKEFYYLRPRWNLRAATLYRIRHEPFTRSTVPQAVNTFYTYLVGDGEVARANQFREWIVQFQRSERLRVCRLLGMARFYGEQSIREMWLALYRSKVPPELKTKGVAYLGLGHTAKSGFYSCHYHMRQALLELGAGERSFEDKEAFREIGEYSRHRTTPPRFVAFVDDFIGTGEQAIRALKQVRNQHPWLQDATVYYVALIGFRRGIAEIKSRLPWLADVLVEITLNEEDRAFSDQNPAWQSDDERTEYETWAADLGRRLLLGRRNYQPDVHCLGWENSQALIFFHYNVPNNTLPVFWGTGTDDGSVWQPLVHRYD